MDNLSFYNQYVEFQKKVDLITSLPNCPFNIGQNDDGWLFDDEGATFNSSTHLSGCGADNYYFTISWDELNQPLEWWDSKFNKLIQQRKKDEENYKKYKEEELKKSEILKLKELQNKYGFNP